MGESVLISVCIPVFNGANYIRESIESVLAQTEGNFELLILDNCSTDNTRDIAAEYSDPRIAIHKNETNVGLFGNFNRCLECAQGEYIVILPHDDLLRPAMLETFSKKLKEDESVAMVYSSYHQINSCAEEIGFCLSQPADRVMTGSEAFELFIRTCPIQCTMIRQKIFSEIGFFDPDLPLTGDVNMWCRIALYGYNVAYLKTPQNAIRVHETSMTRQISERGETGLQLLKCFQKVFDSASTDSKVNELRKVAMKWPMRAQLVYMAQSLGCGEWKKFLSHLDISRQIYIWAGGLRVIPSIITVFFDILTSIPRWLMRKLDVKT